MRLWLILIVVCHFCKAQFPNILVCKQLEPKGLCISIHPKNPNEIIAAAGFANAFYSHNGGRTWIKDSLICEAFNLYGTPVMFWDTTQKAYYSDCAYPNPRVVTDGSWVDRIMVNKSEDHGRSYYNCEDFGKNEKHVQFRHSMCVDPRNNKIHAVWSDIENFESGNLGDSSSIKYCRSADGGKTWSDAKRINHFTGYCRNNDSTLLASTICVDVNGDLYACWAGPQGLAFQHSKDGGSTWFEKEKIIIPYKYGWNYKVNGLHAANGFPTMACDVSNSAHKGRIYICWSDEKNGPSNKDVFLIYSDDKGESWTEPVLVTYYPNQKEQFMPCLRVDNKTGAVYVLYYSKQNSPDNSLTDVYLAVSKNGGLKFDHMKLNQASFSLLKKDSYGDYLGLSAVNGQVRPIWAQRENKKTLSVFTAIINDTTIKAYGYTASQIQMEKTFAFNETVKVNFKANNKLKLTAVITKPLDASFEKQVFTNKTFNAGNNQLLINTKELDLAKGSYILTLYYNGQNSFTWITD